MKIRALLTAAALSVGLFLAPLAGAGQAMAAPAAPPAPEQTMLTEYTVAQEAAGWLANQFTDGQSLTGFDGTPDVSVTIDGVLALVAADAAPEVTASATEWVREQAPGFAVDPATAARTAILATALDEDPTDFGGVNLVEKMTGELGDVAQNPYGLSLLVIGLDRSGTEVPAAVTDALLAAQDAEGAFGFPGYGVDIDTTALAALALALQDENQAATEASGKALDWLLANQCTETSDLCPEPGAYWGSYSPVNTSGLAIGALRYADRPVDKEIAWLVGQQEGSEGFPAAIGAGYSDPYATAQAVVALSGSSMAQIGMPVEQGSGGGANTALLIGIGVAAVVVIAAVILLIARKRR